MNWEEEYVEKRKVLEDILTATFSVALWLPEDLLSLLLSGFPSSSNKHHKLSLILPGLF